MKTGTQFLTILNGIKEALARNGIVEYKIDIGQSDENTMPDLSIWNITFRRDACAWSDVKRAVLEIRNQLFSKTRLEDFDIDRTGDVYGVSFCDDEWEESQDYGYDTPDISYQEFLSQPEPDDFGDGEVASEWAVTDWPEDGWSMDGFDVSELKKLLNPIFSKHGVSPDDVSYYFIHPGTTLFTVKLGIDCLDRLRDANKEIYQVLGEDADKDEDGDDEGYNFQASLEYYATRRIGSSIHDLPQGLVKKTRRTKKKGL